MLVDEDLKITYVNESARPCSAKNLPDFRTIWPSFDPNALIGTCIDVFHRNPAHQRRPGQSGEHAVQHRYFGRVGLKIALKRQYHA